MGTWSGARSPRRGAVAPVQESGVRPLSGDAVVLAAGELGRWQERNARVTLPHVIDQLRQTHHLDNLRAVAEQAVPYQGRYPFLDSHVYKALEGVAYVLAGDAATEETHAFYEEAVGLIERAQAPDGYLNSAFGNPHYGRAPWSDLAWGHELYNLGHLIQAAVAASRQLGDDRLLRVSRRFADLAVDRFGPGGDTRVDGHPEIEMALVELHRETDDPRCLDLARLMVDRRGHRTIAVTHFDHAYFQDAEPLLTLPSVTGHAVRMGYLAAGATDVALETGDARLLGAMRRLFGDMAATKLHFTGGLGSHHTDEAIGDRYELTPDRSYSETCAAIAVMQWAWRLFLATGEVAHLDVFEWVLYNAYAVGLSEDGTCFFYDNPLQRRADHPVPPDGRPLREPWFLCACCPPNVVRWTAQLQDYVAVQTEDGLRIATLTAARITAGGFVLEIDTAYPWAGEVTVRVREAPAAERTLQVRVPGWAEGAGITVDGSTRPAGPGWAGATRRWSPGDELRLSLPMPVRLHAGHPHLDAVRGAAAVARGPLVYCAEAVDGAPVDDVTVERAAPEAAVVSALGEDGGLRTPHVSITLDTRLEPLLADSRLYPRLTPAGEAADGGDGARIPTVLRPYFLWGNREPSPMRVWLRTTQRH